MLIFLGYFIIGTAADFINACVSLVFFLIIFFVLVYRFFLLKRIDKIIEGALNFLGKGPNTQLSKFHKDTTIFYSLVIDLWALSVFSAILSTPTYGIPDLISLASLRYYAFRVEKI